MLRWRFSVGTFLRLEPSDGGCGVGGRYTSRGRQRQEMFLSFFLGDVRPPMRHGAITITATTTGTCTIHWTELALEIEMT